MTIIEQIQAGLQRKFPGADTATLTRIATKKAEGVTDEAQVDSIVEGISLTDVMNNYGDFRAGQAQASAVTNYEKKHGLKDGKPAGKPGTDEDPDTLLRAPTPGALHGRHARLPLPGGRHARDVPGGGAGTHARGPPGGRAGGAEGRVHVNRREP